MSDTAVSKAHIGKQKFYTVRMMSERAGVTGEALRVWLLRHHIEEDVPGAPFALYSESTLKRVLRLRARSAKTKKVA